MATDDQPSSGSPFDRFAKAMKALIAVPKRELDEKIAEVRRKRAKRKRSQKTA